MQAPSAAIGHVRFTLPPLAARTPCTSGEIQEQIVSLVAPMAALSDLCGSKDKSPSVIEGSFCFNRLVRGIHLRVLLFLFYAKGGQTLYT